MTTEQEKLISTPEWRLQIDLNLTQNDIKSNDFIVVRIVRFDEKNNGFFVTFGNNIKGFIPSDEVFLCEYSNEKRKRSIYFMIGKNVLTKVSSYSIDKKAYILSRKSALYESFLRLNVNKAVKGMVVSVGDRNIFVDLGAGFVSKINVKNLSEFYVSSCRNIGVLPGDEIDAIVCSKNSEEYWVELSRKDFYEPYEYHMDEFEIGQIVKGRILARLNHKVEDIFPYSYYVEIIPNVVGIVNSWVEIPEGALITTRISKIKEKGLKLKMLGLISK